MPVKAKHFGSNQAMAHAVQTLPGSNPTRSSLIQPGTVNTQLSETSLSAASKTNTKIRMLLNDPFRKHNKSAAKSHIYKYKYQLREA